MCVLAGPSDWLIVRDVVGHLRRSAQFPFSEVILVYDDMPRKGGSSAGGLIAAANIMLAAGEVTKLISLSRHNSDSAVPHYSPRPLHRRDYRGIPLHGWIAGLEASNANYLFHSDCDIFIHSDLGYSWIQGAIEVLDQNETLLFVAPRGGPPGNDESVEPLSLRKGFSSRRYVTHRQRLTSLLPLDLRLVQSRRMRLAALIGLRSPYETWEMHVNFALMESPYFSAYLNDRRAWSLHSPDHSPEWQRLVPSIVDAVERGTFPREQIGNVELRLDAWSAFLSERTA